MIITLTHSKERIRLAVDSGITRTLLDDDPKVRASTSDGPVDHDQVADVDLVERDVPGLDEAHTESPP